MRARVFRMHGRRLELPRGIALDRRIVVDVAIADGGDRTSEFVVVLGVEHGDQPIGSRDGHKRKQARAVHDAEFLVRRQGANDGIVDPAVDRQPEADVFDLPIGALGTGSAAERLDFIVVGGPFRAFEGIRAAGRNCDALGKANGLQSAAEDRLLNHRCRHA